MHLKSFSKKVTSYSKERKIPFNNALIPLPRIISPKKDLSRENFSEFSSISLSQERYLYHYIKRVTECLNDIVCLE